MLPRNQTVKRTKFWKKAWCKACGQAVRVHKEPDVDSFGNETFFVYGSEPHHCEKMKLGTMDISLGSFPKHTLAFSQAELILHKLSE